MEAGDIAEKLLRLISKWARLAWVWALKFAKMRAEKFRLARAQKKLDRRMSRLGAEFYSLHKMGETDFLKSLVVHQQLKIIQEAESRLFAVHDRIRAVEKKYGERKEAIMRQPK